MDVFIHKDVLGFEHHLVCQPSGKILKISEIPEDALIVYGEPSILEISKLYGITLPTFPPQSYVKALQGVLMTRDVSEVPWKFALPLGAFKRAVEGIAKDLVNLFSELDLSYYQKHYSKTVSFLHKMKRAKIDIKAWKFHSLNKDLVTPHVFETFQPDENWFASEVSYSKCDTKTGRLKVTQGPNILHLPKEQRNILVSRFGYQGKIISLDYSSIEPRTLLFLKSFPVPPSPSGSVPLLLENPSKTIFPNPFLLPYGSVPLLGVMAPEEDIYLSILKSLGALEIPREVIKEVVLSQLYGAGYESLLNTLVGVRDPFGLIEAVNGFFGLGVLKERLIKEYESNNREFILSYYGRRLDTREAKPYMLLNYFTQSTAVDIVLYGFRNILREVNDPRIIPLFILHDALILDVHNDAYESLNEICKAGTSNIPMFPNCEFPLKLSRF